MSHIHIPDGVMPLWLILLGWIGAACLLGWATRRLGRRDIRQSVPRVGVMAAAMLVAMSTEFVPIGYHMNLTVVAGIMVGPALGIVAAFIVVLILALFGHGGITVVGLNTLVIGAECVLGWLLFRVLTWGLGARIKSPGVLAGAATVLTLIVTTSLLIGIVALSQADVHIHATALEQSQSPLAEGVLRNTFVGGEHEHVTQKMNMAAFALLTYGLGAIGWVIEAFISGVIVQFIARVRRDLIFEPGREEGACETNGAGAPPS
jgi:cobalt/nickel transport system permease protein